MAIIIDYISSGTITSPQGFKAGATCAGIKEKAANALDLGILFSEEPCVTAAVFTTNRIKAAPVILCQQRLQEGKVTALVVNSGCANAFTGEAGLADAAEMAALVARDMGIPAEDVLVASTGVIGQRLSMEKIRAGLGQVVLSGDGGHELAKAIMTTDTRPKEVAVSVNIDGSEFIIGGIAKGSGMIHPDMATMLCFLTTNATVEADFLKQALQKAADVSFNMVSIDGDTSPNDTVLLMANGMAGNNVITANTPEGVAFQQGLEMACISLAKDIARDGEGATKLIEINVTGAVSIADARLAARAIVSSPLVKAAVHGNDPNWGRIVAAAGRSGAGVAEAKIDLYLGDICLVEKGSVQPFSKQEAVTLLKRDEIVIKLQLNLGNGEATAWGCDLSEEYVVINSQYTT
jgi:glutamate N-acetyltransferase/amino-acid N-acetyltransferase